MVPIGCNMILMCETLNERNKRPRERNRSHRGGQRIQDQRFNILGTVLWIQLMLASVGVGEELMPHRNQVEELSNSQSSTVPEGPRRAAPTTPIRKLSRNRGLVLQEQTVVDDSPESDDYASRAAAIRKGKCEIG